MRNVNLLVRNRKPKWFVILELSFSPNTIILEIHKCDITMNHRGMVERLEKVGIENAMM